MATKRKTNTDWVLGPHAVASVFSTNPERAIELVLLDSAGKQTRAEILNQAQAIGLPVQMLEKAKLTKRCKSDHHQGVALLVRPRAEGNENDLGSLISNLMKKDTPPLLLILDQVQDPHNFGACLRTADAAGVAAVIVAKDNACPVTAVVQKVASGAADTLAIFRVSNLVRSIKMLQQKGIWVIGTSDQADNSIYQTDLTGPLALVMGAEGRGLRQLTEKNCDSLVKLPMAGSIVSSLNVSVATGVCLYEAVRQRNVF